MREVRSMRLAASPATTAGINVNIVSQRRADATHTAVAHQYTCTKRHLGASGLRKKTIKLSNGGPGRGRDTNHRWLLDAPLFSEAWHKAALLLGTG
eukprot:2575775-Amphidinium_carterae.1